MSADAEEGERFKKVAAEWFNPTGPYAILMRMNPVRTGYISDAIKASNPNATPTHPLKGMTILDIGCGGGFLSQSLTVLGAKVTGVDATLENIAVAKAHKDAGDIEFIHCTAGSIASNRLEDLITQGRVFDCVCSLEVIEHVVDPKDFVSLNVQLVKPDGFVFFSTINRNILAYVLTILIAEKILGWIPDGSHTLEKYVTTNELREYCNSGGADVLDISGNIYDPIFQKWHLVSGSNWLSLAVNYILTARKRAL